MTSLLRAHQMKTLLQTAPPAAGSKSIAIPLDPPAPRVIGTELPRGLDALRGGLLVAPIGLALWAGVLWLVIG